MSNLLLNLGYRAWIQAARLINPKRRNALFVVLLGGPGAGKGTIAAMLSTKNSLPTISTGNMIRRQIAEKTAFGKQWESVVKSGGLIPDWAVFQLLKKELEKPEYYKGAILDGFPRTVNQAKMLRNLLACWGNQVDVAILLDVSKEDLIERLSLRRTCEKTSCARTYHLRFSPPKQEGICDVCGSKIVQRADETPEALVMRMHEFNRTFQPLRDYYDDLHLLAPVKSTNAMGIDKVFEEVIFKINEVD